MVWTKDKIKVLQDNFYVNLIQQNPIQKENIKNERKYCGGWKTSL